MARQKDSDDKARQMAGACAGLALQALAGGELKVVLFASLKAARSFASQVEGEVWRLPVGHGYWVGFVAHKKSPGR